MEMNELASFLVWFIFRSLIPTGFLVLGKITGAFPFTWAWTLLPTVSGLFFLVSYLLGMAILRTAQAAASRQP
jgi:hypothetical protein